MKGSRFSAPQAVVTSEAGPTSFRCGCGGIVTMSSEPLFGRTLEQCDGPCGYVGRPRLDAETAALLANRDGTAPIAPETPEDPEIVALRAAKEAERANYRMCATEGCGNRCSRVQDTICGRCGTKRRRQMDIDRCAQRKKGAA